MDGCSPYLAFFRGQIFDWPIKSNITRNPDLQKEEIFEKEKAFFSDYSEEKLGIKVLKHDKKYEFEYAQDWYNLFQAQHLGFYTRLTDWTQSFVNALFFASDDETVSYSEKDGVVWIYKCPYYNKEFLINFNKSEDEIFFNKNPLELDKFYVIKHPILFDEDFMKYAGEMRRFRQDGSFIISTSQDINKPIEQIEYIIPHLEKIIISPELKASIKNYLNPTLRDYFYYASEENNLEDLAKIREITKKSNDALFWGK